MSNRRSALRLALGFLGIVLILMLIYLAVPRTEDFDKVKKFVVVIPSYNNAKWYQKNLDSVFTQDYPHYRVIYLDDASLDGTGNLVKDYVREKGLDRRVTLIQNENRVGSLANLYKAISSCNPKEIIVQLDGDDWFAQPKVLSILNEVYSDPDVWITYGQFAYYDGNPGWADQLPLNVIETNSVRRYPRWVTTALRTFYAGLFQKINKEDLLFNGNFFPMAGDLAFMFPMIEMAGKHSRFIPTVLYIYNIATGINDQTANRSLQQSLGDLIRMRKPYQPIENPW